MSLSWKTPPVTTTPIQRHLISQFHGREEPEIMEWMRESGKSKSEFSPDLFYCLLSAPSKWFARVPMSLELKKAERGHHSFIREKKIFLCHIPKMRMRVPSYWSFRQVRVSSGAWPRRSSAKPIEKRERSGQAKLLPFALYLFIYDRVEQRLLYLS